jgi:hypothetical protein
MISKEEIEMAKTKRRQKTDSDSKVQSTSDAPKNFNTPKPHADSKQEKVLTLLRRSEGTTIAALMKVTGWQQHSVRSFLAGVVRRKLHLTLQTEKTDGKRIYRIVAPKPSKAKSSPQATDVKAA